MSKLGRLKPPRGAIANGAHPLARGRVGHWLFNEGSGLRAFDYSGHENIGTLTNMTEADWVGGRAGLALDFDGVSDYVAVAQSTSLDLQNDKLAITAGVFWTEGPDNSEYILYGAGEPYLLRIISSGADNGKVQFRILTAGGQTNLLSAIALTKSVWTDVAAVYDGANMLIYLNGNLSNSVAKTGNVVALTGGLYLGADLVGGDAFAGKLEEVKLYGRAPSPDEVRWLCQDSYCMFDHALEQEIAGLAVPLWSGYAFVI